MEGSAASCTEKSCPIWCVLHLLWGEITAKLNVEQGRTNSQKSETHKTRSFKGSSRAVVLQEWSRDQSASLGKLFRSASYQVLPRPTKSETLGAGPSNLGFNKPSKGSQLSPVKRMVVQLPHSATSLAVWHCFQLKNVSMRGRALCFHRLWALEMTQVWHIPTTHCGCYKAQSLWHHSPKAWEVQWDRYEVVNHSIVVSIQLIKHNLFLLNHLIHKQWSLHGCLRQIRLGGRAYWKFPESHPRVLIQYIMVGARCFSFWTSYQIKLIFLVQGPSFKNVCTREFFLISVLGTLAQ